MSVPRSPTKLDSLQQDLPAKSSQYGTLWPTKLDKIKNLFPEVQADRLAVSLVGAVSPARCAYDRLGNTEELASWPPSL